MEEGRGQRVGRQATSLTPAAARDVPVALEDAVHAAAGDAKHSRQLHH